VGTVRGQPAACRAALAILLLVAVLRRHEFRFQRHRAIVAGGDDGGGQQGMEILDTLTPALAVRAVRAADLVGAMEFGAVQRDQGMAAEHLHGSQPLRAVKITPQADYRSVWPFGLNRPPTDRTASSGQARLALAAQDCRIWWP